MHYVNRSCDRSTAVEKYAQPCKDTITDWPKNRIADGLREQRRKTTETSGILTFNHQERFALEYVVHWLANVARFLLEMLWSMWILISCAISSYTCPDIGFISNTSWIVITAWPAQACKRFVSNSPWPPQVPDFFREVFSLIDHGTFQPLNSPVPNKDGLLVVLYRISSQSSPFTNTNNCPKKKTGNSDKKSFDKKGP